MLVPPVALNDAKESLAPPIVNVPLPALNKVPLEEALALDVRLPPKIKLPFVGRSKV